MNKALINILLFCAFSIPFPFLAMYQDKFYGIAVGYACSTLYNFYYC
ncbi:hypothetical protein bcgnr5390_10810 [Bacillus luti]|nr:hypothetical protein BC2903_30090 [Bacillus cereus]